MKTIPLTTFYPTQVVYFLAPEEKIKALIQKFKRVFKPGGKLIVSMMSRKNSYCIEGKPLGNQVFEFSQEGVGTYRCLITWDETHLRNMFSEVQIDEIGYFDNFYLGHPGITKWFWLKTINNGHRNEYLEIVCNPHGVTSCYRSC